MTDGIHPGAGKDNYRVYKDAHMVFSGTLKDEVMSNFLVILRKAMRLMRTKPSL